MSEEVMLTKIAKLANDKIISNANNIIFRYKDKRWILMDNYKDIAGDLFKLIDDGN